MLSVAIVTLIGGGWWVFSLFQSVRPFISKTHFHQLFSSSIIGLFSMDYRFLQRVYLAHFVIGHQNVFDQRKYRSTSLHIVHPVGQYMLGHLAGRIVYCIEQWNCVAATHYGGTLFRYLDSWQLPLHDWPLDQSYNLHKINQWSSNLQSQGDQFWPIWRSRHNIAMCITRHNTLEINMIQ